MYKYPFPVGGYTYFQGNEKLEEIFGIVYVKITCPTDLEVPMLLTSHNGKTIAPVGKWEGWYVTEELKNASKYGYQFEILEGYHWKEKEYLFKDFVSEIYQMRQSYPKSDCRNLICKLILNSFYGKFGMSPHQVEYKFIDKNIISEEEYSKIQDNSINSLMFGDIELIGIKTTKNTSNKFNIINKNRGKNKMNINTPIAMMVTAYSRLHMADLKIQYKDHIPRTGLRRYRFISTR
jgi:hypothetical protein